MRSWHRVGTGSRSAKSGVWQPSGSHEHLVRARARAPLREGVAAWLPSVRSLLVGMAALLLAAGVYAVARGTSMFAIERVEVQGVPPGVAARVRVRPRAAHRIEPSVVRCHRRQSPAGSRARRCGGRLRPRLPSHAGCKRGSRASDRTVAKGPGRVGGVGHRPRFAKGIRETSSRPACIWLPATADPLVGAVVADDSGLAVSALATVRDVHLPIPIRSVKLADGEITLTLSSGTDVLMGDRSRFPLKAAVAARILEAAPTAQTIDVSVPERVVTSDTALNRQQSEG